MYYVPRGVPTSVGVLICPPFGIEDQLSYRPRHLWAEHLADQGHASLRIDFPGTGNSGGGPRDAQLVDAWVQSVGTAVDWLRAEGGCDRVAVIGVGLGGFVAAEAVRRGLAIDGLALWAAPARGRRLVRELRAFANMDVSATYSMPAGEAIPEGALAISGYLMTRETASALEAIDLSLQAPLDGLPVLLLDRDEIPADVRLVSGFRDAGAAVTLGPGPGVAPHPNQEPQLYGPTPYPRAAISLSPLRR